MKVLHLISGGETGGSKNHLISLLQQFNKEEVMLGVFQEGKLSKEARELGLPVVLFGQSSRYDFSVLKKIKTLIKEQNITIVHTHGPRANLFTYFLRKQINFKWITTIHSDPSKDFIKGGVKGKVFTWLNMKVLKEIDYFFAVSNRFKEMLVEFGLDSKKIFVIYNSIPFDEVYEQKITREDLCLKETDFLIVMVARLHPIKGHELAFKSIKDLSNQGYNQVKLLLIGDGPIGNELKQKVDQLELSEKIKFLGYQKDVHSYLALSDVKLLASYSESFPLVILEAARAETPVISTDVGGVKDLISEKRFGWVVPVGEVDGITNAIKEAIEDKKNGVLKEKAFQLKDRAIKEYSLQRLHNDTYSTYLKIKDEN
ncbi:glycosyltransferase [Rossellomorea sp. YZS02]|uniref:glycosyltransferase n=1 Tax=Rossellomorea sp. YZS02 TaxID=3097358 RepID=UPI002A11B27E|nr:glycosyltransferase [Rossellomorea sp. YZS02]MDX8343181.1 glycosyltransferase [Rossellomorea sp. YZS02]